jgi:hypothetical protein
MRSGCQRACADGVFWSVASGSRGCGRRGRASTGTSTDTAGLRNVPSARCAGSRRECAWVSLAEGDRRAARRVSGGGRCGFGVRCVPREAAVTPGTSGTGFPASETMRTPLTTLRRELAPLLRPDNQHPLLPRTPRYEGNLNRPEMRASEARFNAARPATGGVPAAGTPHFDHHGRHMPPGRAPCRRGRLSSRPVAGQTYRWLRAGRRGPH